VKLTGNDTGAPPVGVIVTVPLYVEAARPDGFTVTIRLVGVALVPLGTLLISSQFPLVEVVAEYVNMPPDAPLTAAM
jgi:hypothetical protein